MNASVGDAESGCVLLCVGETAPATTTLELCVQEALRRGTGVLLLHVLSLGGHRGDEQARQVTIAHARMSLAQKRAREVAAARVEVAVTMRHGSVIETIVERGERASLIVMERPALVKLAADPSPSVTATVAELASTPTVTVPVLWHQGEDEIAVEHLPWQWIEQGKRPVVTVVLDDPGDSRHTLESAIAEADRRNANVEFLHSWNDPDRRPSAAIAEVSARSALLVVGSRTGEDEPLTAISRAAIHESKCPVLVVPIDHDEQEPAPVLPLRRAARG